MGVFAIILSSLGLDLSIRPSGCLSAILFLPSSNWRADENGIWSVTEIREKEEAGFALFLSLPSSPNDDFIGLISFYPVHVYRGRGRKADPRLRDCSRPGLAEMVATAAAIFSKPGARLLAEPCMHVAFLEDNELRGLVNTFT